jgi:hypothetical protein
VNDDLQVYQFGEMLGYKLKTASQQVGEEVNMSLSANGPLLLGYVISYPLQAEGTML